MGRSGRRGRAGTTNVAGSMLRVLMSAFPSRKASPAQRPGSVPRSADRVVPRAEQPPSGATVNEFEDLQDRVLALYSDRRFEEMLALLHGAVERFPDHRVGSRSGRHASSHCTAHQNSLWSDSDRGPMRDVLA
jgi:hypothetical protein